MFGVFSPCVLYTKPAQDKVQFRDSVDSPFSPRNSPLSYPAVNRYSSSSLSSQASAEVSNITGQSESSDEVFNMQVLEWPSAWSCLCLACLQPGPSCPLGCAVL